MCSDRIPSVTDCIDQDGGLIQLWCSHALVCTHLVGRGSVDRLLNDGPEDVPGWYNCRDHNLGQILCDHEEICPSAYAVFSLPADYCNSS